MLFKERVQEYLDWCYAIGYSETTFTSKKWAFETYILPSVGDLPISSLKASQIAKIGVRRGKPHTHLKCIVTIRAYLKYLQEDGVDIPFDYRDIAYPSIPYKNPVSLDEVDLERILGKLPRNRLGARTRALLEVLYSTGLRISECLALNLKDVPWDTRSLVVKNVKTGDEQYIYFSERCLYWLKEYLLLRADDHEALFVNDKGTARLKQVTSRAALKRLLGGEVDHHVFRRTFVTHLLQKGVDIKSTQCLARHRSDRTTLRYYASINQRVAEDHHRRIFG